MRTVVAFGGEHRKLQKFRVDGRLGNGEGQPYKPILAMLVDHFCS